MAQQNKLVKNNDLEIRSINPLQTITKVLRSFKNGLAALFGGIRETMNPHYDQYRGRINDDLQAGLMRSRMR